MADPNWADIEVVTTAYEQCWQLSKGRYNSWIDGRLDPLARRFYIVVNAAERCLMDGVSSLLEDTRFTLAETEEAFKSFNFDAQACAVRELALLVDDKTLPRNRKERDRQLNEIVLSPADIDRLNDLFPGDEHELWRRLAEFVRTHPASFPTCGGLRT